MGDNKEAENQSTKQECELPEAERHIESAEQAKMRGEQLMSTTVQCPNQDHQSMTLTLWSTGLVLGELTPVQGKNKKTKGIDAAWCDVIAVHKPEKEYDDDQETLILHYIEKQKNKTLRCKKAELTCTEDNSDAISKIIQEQCEQKVPNRPKKLFVLINPIGGNRKGPAVYKKTVAPMFNLAKCETTVVVTEKAKHAIEIGENTDFSGYDGIVCVSGDGMYQELVEGYVRQLQKTAGIDSADPDANLVNLDIPFGLIPTGSTNGMARYSNDCVADVETCALRVLRGEVHRANMLTVYEPGKFVGVCILAFAVGLLVDILKHSDERRWMKKMRYVYSIPAVMLKKRRKYNAKVQYILEGETGPESVQDDGTKKSNVWQTFDVTGKVHTNTTFMASRLMDTNGSKTINIFSSSGFLLLDTGCTNWGLFKLSRALMQQGGQVNGIQNVDVKDKVVGLKIIMESDSGSTEQQSGGAEDANKHEDTKGEDLETGQSQGAVEDQNKASKETEPKGDAGKTEAKGDAGKTEATGDAGKTDTDTVQQGTGDDSDEEDEDEIYVAIEKDKKKKADAQTKAREDELEHLVYLDGEVRPIDGRELEVRLHRGFVRMFGCLPSGLAIEGEK